MTIGEILLLGLAGFMAGIANAVAGGGTFFPFAAMVAFGMPTLEANATCAVALVPGSLATAAAYRKELRAHWRDLVPFAVISLVGGTAGGLILLSIGDEGFRPMVPWLLAVATLTFAFSARIRVLFAGAHGSGQGMRAGAYLVMCLVAVYGGFFGAGMGIMILAALAVILSGDFHKANAIKNIAAMLSQTSAVVMFILGALVHWPEAAIVAVTATGGGYLGVSVARHVPEWLVRGVVVATGAVLTVVFLIY